MAATLAQHNPSSSAVACRWRDVFCIVEHAHRDMSIADNVCAGIFTHAGLTLELGCEPDWLTAQLPADDEWRIEWYKFYFGLDLAYAFSLTGDERYRSTWMRLVQTWIAQMPAGCDSSDVTARRVLNWIYTWNAFSRTADFDPDFENQIVAHIAAQVSHLRHHLTPERNHRTLELYALFIVALALPELDEDELLNFALTELHRNLLRDVRADGVHREQSTHYHAVVLRSFLGVRENCRRFGLEVPSGYDERLEKACEFLLHVQRPDGFIPALSDADTGNYADLLRLAALIFNRADFLYSGTAGAHGLAPTIENASFPDGGYFIQRSGWGDSASSFRRQKYLVFDCGPLGDGGHGHYDLLNIEVAANGKPLIVDPGRFTYSEDDSNWRHYFKGTAAHNTVCVDGLDQMVYRCGKPKDAAAQGRLLARVTTSDFDMLCGEVRSPVYDAIHTRRIFFVGGAYWLIVDCLRGLVPHKYDLRFHLSAEAWNHCVSLATPQHSGVRTPDLLLLFEPHLEPAVTLGWISKKYGTKEVAPVVSVVTDGCVNADFYTLVAPLKLNATAPYFQVEQDGSDALNAGHVRVLWDDAIDHIIWNGDDDASCTRASVEGVAS